MNPMLQQAREALGGAMPQPQQAPEQLYSPFSEAMRNGLQNGAFGQMGNQAFQGRYDPRQVQEPQQSLFAQMLQGGMFGGPRPGGPRPGGPMPGGPRPGGPMPGGPMPGSAMPGGQRTIDPLGQFGLRPF